MKGPSRYSPVASTDRAARPRARSSSRDTSRIGSIREAGSRRGREVVPAAPAFVVRLAGRDVARAVDEPAFDRPAVLRAALVVAGARVLDAFALDAFALDAFVLDAFVLDAFVTGAPELEAAAVDAVRAEARRVDPVRPDPVVAARRAEARPARAGRSPSAGSLLDVRRAGATRASSWRRGDAPGRASPSAAAARL